MLGFLAQLAGFLVGLFFPRTKAPPVAERAGAAEARLQDKEKTNARIDEAVRARDAVITERMRNGHDREVHARKPDPFSRD